MRRILIADDSHNTRGIVRFMLDSKRYEVIEAADGQEALDKARASRFDLIVLDAMMPRLDGYAACAALKEDSATAAIPVVMITAAAESAHGTVRRWRPELRPDAVLPKPFKLADLLATIERLLPSDALDPT
ncbi:MAG TPA: response regulator [Planctomycetota bacterium]|nr:response regulator [Planctomycetota bacterium]